MSKWLPRSIGKKELVSGLPYFSVGVWLDGHMELDSVFVPIGKPFNNKRVSSLFIRSRFYYERRCYDDEISLRDHGIVGPRYNLWATFRFNTKSYKFLKGIVAKQDLDAYKKLIGVK